MNWAKFLSLFSSCCRVPGADYQDEVSLENTNESTHIVETVSNTTFENSIGCVAANNLLNSSLNSVKNSTKFETASNSACKNSTGIVATNQLLNSLFRSVRNSIPKTSFERVIDVVALNQRLNPSLSLVSHSTKESYDYVYEPITNWTVMKSIKQYCAKNIALNTYFMLNPVDGKEVDDFQKIYLDSLPNDECLQGLTHVCKTYRIKKDKMNGVYVFTKSGYEAYGNDMIEFAKFCPVGIRINVGPDSEPFDYELLFNIPVRHFIQYIKIVVDKNRTENLVISNKSLLFESLRILSISDNKQPFDSKN